MNKDIKEKILFVYDSMMIGGTTTALLSLIDTIDREKYDIYLILYTNTGPLIDEIPNYVKLLNPACKKIRFLGYRKRKIIKTVLNGRLFLALRAWKKYKNTPKGNLRQILTHYGMKAQVSLSRTVKEEFDYAIGFMEGWADEYVASSKIKAKKKFVWIHPQYKSCFLIPEIDEKIIKKVDGVVIISSNCMGQFLEFFKKFESKVNVIPNITSSECLKKKADKEEVIVKNGNINFCTVARCDIQVKGLDRLLKCFYELKKEGLTKSVLWHFIGGGKEFEYFKNEVKKLQLNDVVVLYGDKLNPLPYLKQMDVFVLASRYEGKPVSVTEAQILGVPCIVTKYESASAQVHHSHNGLVVNNDYESIYNAIKGVIENPSQILEWKKNTLQGEFSNEYDIEKFYELLHLDS